MSLVDLVESVRALGWSLVHFLWQGALIAIALELALLVLRRASSEVRYAVRCAALLAMGLAPLATFVVLRAGAPASVAEASGAVADGGPTIAWRAELGLLAVVAAWAVGASVFGARLVRDWLRIRRVQESQAGAPLPREWQERFDALRVALGVRAVARVVDSAVLGVPTVIGWMRPMVLVPARVLTGLDPEQVEALLAHELAHVRRHDYLVNLLQSAVEAVLFYHPAVWFVSRGIRAEREYCCDDVALCVTTDRVSYARALTTLEAWRGAELQTAMSTLGGPLMLRIQRMIGAAPSRARTRGPVSLGSLGSALGALLALTLLGASALASPAVQDSDELRAIRARLDQVQAHLDHLRAMLDHALAGESEEPAEGGAHHGTVEVHGPGAHGAHGGDDAREHEEDVHMIDLGNAIRGELGQRLGGTRIHVITEPGADGKTLTIDAELELDGDVLELDGKTLRLRGKNLEVRGLDGKTVTARRFSFDCDGMDGHSKVHVLRGVHDHLLEVLEGIGVWPHGELVPGVEDRHARPPRDEHVRKLHDHLMERILGEDDGDGHRVDLQWVIRKLHGDDADDDGPKQRVQVHGVDLDDVHEHLRRAIEVDGDGRRIEIRGPRIEIRIDGDVEGLHERLRDALKGVEIRIQGSSDGADHEEASPDAPRDEARTRRLV